MATSYLDDYSVGNRTAAPNQIVVTAALAVTGPITELVNGTFGNTFYFPSGQTAQALTFDFGAVNAANVIIQEFKWYQDNASSHGTWQFEGSNNNTSYTTIGATFTLGGVATQTVTTMSANTTAYRYYRIRQVAGTTSNSPWLREIEFKLERVTYPAADLYVSAIDAQYLSQYASDLQVSALDTQYLSQYASHYQLGAIDVQVVVSAKQKKIPTRTNIEIIRSKVARTNPLFINETNFMV